jgi:transaldolase
MKIFLDTADLAELRRAAAWGVVDGVTTNPSLIAKAGRPIDEQIRAICEIVDGDVSAEVISTQAAEMVTEGRRLAGLHPNVVVKLPLTRDGIAACSQLGGEGIRTNVTLCFSPGQALLAAKAGAYIVSPFVGRLDDIGWNGTELIQNIVEIYRNYGYKTQVLAASLRHPIHVNEAALAGADIATLPFKVLDMLFNHPLTDKGLEQFLRDYARTFQQEGVLTD